MCTALIAFALGEAFPLRGLSPAHVPPAESIRAFHSCIAPYATPRYSSLTFTLPAAERALDIATAEDACLDLSGIAGLGLFRIACASGYQFTITPKNQSFYNTTRLALPHGWKGILFTKPLATPITLGASRCSMPGRAAAAER